MTFADAVGRVCSYAGQATGGDFETQVKSLMNEVYLGLLDLTEVPTEHREFTFVSAASTSQYGMPLYVKEVLNIEDPTTPQFVFQSNRRMFDQNYAGATETGTPVASYSLGVRGVQKFPAANGLLTLVSDSTADTGTNYKVRVTGFNASGALVTELVTLAGTTAASTTNSYSATLGVERLVKAPNSGYTFTGNITVADSSANTIAVIPVWWKSPSYCWIELFPIPSAAITYTVRASMRKPPLVNGDDWIDLPEEYHLLCVFGVTKDLLGGMGMATLANQHRASYKELETRFKRACIQSPGSVFTFSDVHSAASYHQRPRRPWLEDITV